MYNYNFENEKVQYEFNNIYISINDVEFIGNILITEKNILLFKDLNQNNPLKSRGVSYPGDYELIKKIKLKEKYIFKNNYTLIEEFNIKLYNLDLNMIKIS